MKITELIHAIASTSSKKDKELLLGNNDTATLRKLLLDTFDYRRNYYIKKIDIGTHIGNNTIDSNYDIFSNHLNILSSRALTGNLAITKTKEVIESFISEDQQLLKKILLRDLEGGFSESTVNKALGQFIPTFDVSLAVNAYTYDVEFNDAGNVTLSSIRPLNAGNYVVSRKLDGLRCIAVKNNSNLTMYTRNGGEILTLDKVKQEIIEKFGVDSSFVLDGEICIVDENGKEDFSAIVSQYNKKNFTIENPKYLVFDILTIEEFENGFGHTSHTERMQRLDIVESNRICKLNHLKLNAELFDELQTRYKELGWEGLIMRRDVGYKAARNDNMVKIKAFEDTEYVVTGIETGKLKTTEAGAGTVYIDNACLKLIIEHKGNPVGVGSGLSVQHRIEFANNPSLIIGKEITVQYTEESSDKTGKKSLRFPRLKAIWESGTRNV